MTYTKAEEWQVGWRREHSRYLTLIFSITLHCSETQTNLHSFLTFIYIHIGVYPNVCVCTTCVQCLWSQRRALKPLWLELDIAVSHHGGRATLIVEPSLHPMSTSYKGWKKKFHSYVLQWPKFSLDYQLVLLVSPRGILGPETCYVTSLCASFYLRDYELAFCRACSHPGAGTSCAVALTLLTF